MKMNRSHFFSLMAACVATLALTSHAQALMFSSVDLDLADPNSGDPNMRPNEFQTVVSTEVPSPLGGTIPISTPEFTVIYVDPNMSGMQVDLDIDFTDPNAPVIGHLWSVQRSQQ